MTEFYFLFLDQHATQTCSQGRFGAEMGNDMFGAAIMGYNPDIDSQKCVMRIENVELNYVGQAYRYDLIDRLIHSDLCENYMEIASAKHNACSNKLEIQRRMLV